MRHLDVEPRGEVFFFFWKNNNTRASDFPFITINFLFSFFWLEKIGKHWLRNLEKNRFLSWKASPAKDSQKACDLTVLLFWFFPSMPRFSSPPHKSIGALLGQVLMWKQSSRWGYSKMWLCASCKCVIHTQSKPSKQEGWLSVHEK